MFVPDKIKWAVKMPNRNAVRTLSYYYKEEPIAIVAEEEDKALK